MNRSPSLDSKPGRCLLCSGSRCSVVFVEHGIDVVRCRQCGHVSSTFQQATDYDQYWGDQPITESHRYWFEEAHRAMYQAFIRRFMRDQRGRLLDVGAGLGYFLDAIKNVPEWDLHGYEIAPRAVDYARHVLGIEGMRCGRVQDADYAPRSFTLVTLWDVIEHIPCPHELLRALRTLLAPRGRLFLHTPNALIQLPKAHAKKLFRGMQPGVHYLEARDHVHIYTPSTIRLLLEQCGFGNIRFHHLPPIQSVSGSRGVLLRTFKRAGFAAAGLIAALSRERINYDNLFVTCEPAESLERTS